MRATPSPDELIPLCVPSLQGNEWKYVKDCLDTNWISSVGSYVDRFEETVAQYTGTSFAVATVNGTSALHIALLVAGIEPDDEVLVSTLSFIAPANAIRYAGAWPVFIDAECEHWQMDTNLVHSFIINECESRGAFLYNKKTGRRVRGLLPVHILGHPVDMDPLLALARKYQLVVIEDASESIGAKYKGRMVGSLGDIGCFSFNGNKLITTGGGGMIVTNNPSWAKRAKYLSTQAKDDPVEYIHNEVGYNYRLPNILAAIGCAQMEHVDTYIRRKREIAHRYDNALSCRAEYSLMKQAEWGYCTYWMYTVLIKPELHRCTRVDLIKNLSAAGIQCRSLWLPLHLNPAHFGSIQVCNGTAEILYQQSISLPCSVSLTPEEQSRVIHMLLKE